MHRVGPSTVTRDLGRILLRGQAAAEIRAQRTDLRIPEVQRVARWTSLVTGIAADTLHALDALIYQVRLSGWRVAQRESLASRLLKYVLKTFTLRQHAVLGALVRRRWAQPRREEDPESVATLHSLIAQLRPGKS